MLLCWRALLLVHLISFISCCGCCSGDGIEAILLWFCLSWEALFGSIVRCFMVGWGVVVAWIV